MSLIVAGVLGYNLDSFADGVFSQFTGQKQPDGSLVLAKTGGRFLVVVSKARRFLGDALSLTNEFTMPMALLEIPVSG